VETDSQFENPYLRQAPRLLAVTGVGLISVVAGIALGFTNLAKVLLVCGLVVGTVSGILAFGWYFAGRSIEAHLEAFRNGKGLASWTLEPEQWNLFASEMRGANRLVALVLGVMLGLCGVFVGWMIDADADPNGKPIMIWSAVGGVALWVVLHQVLALAWKPVRHPVNVVYGLAAGVFHRKIISWNTVGYTLMGATLNRETSRIHFSTEVQNQHGKTLITHRLPFPPGAVDEAEKLVARYNQLV